MADLTITPGNVLKDSSILPGNEDKSRVSGEVVDAGECFYIDTANNNVAKLAENGGTELQATAYAMAVNSSEVAGQTIDGVTEGLVTIGTHGLAIGTPLFVSANPGKIAPLADLTLGTSKAKLVGTIANTTQIYVSLKAPPPYPVDP